MTTTPTLEQLGSFLDPILALTYRGKQYRFQSVDAETGVRLQKMVSGGIDAQRTGNLAPEFVELVSDAEEKGFYEMVLGDTHAELVADGVSFHALKQIGNTVLMWAIQDFAAAEEYFLAEGKAPAPKGPQDHKPKTATRTGTAAATTTRKRASASSTTTPKATASRASNGRKS